MALGSHSLIRATWPNRFNRRPTDALGLVPHTAVLPHFETFGHRWIESAERELPGATLLGIDERTGMIDDGDEGNEGNEGEAGRKKSWRVYGEGAVTLYRKGKPTVFRAGETFRDDFK